jgi:putative ATPase
VKRILWRANRTLCEESGTTGVSSQEIIDYLADLADGDGKCVGDTVDLARSALNMFELTFSLALKEHQKGGKLSVETLRPLLLRTQVVYDRLGDKHYDTISAFIKSMRGSSSLSRREV